VRLDGPVGSVAAPFLADVAARLHEVPHPASNLKRLTLELGGKAPSIICADADVDSAVAGNISGSMLNSGQVCAAYTRFYVHSSRHDEFVEKMAAGIAGLTVRPGSEESTVVGPLVSAEHLAHVERLVATGSEQGAQLVTGGRRIDR